MEDPKEQQSVEHDINDLKQSLDKYTAEDVHPSPELVPDLTQAIHRIGDHLVALHRRVERLEGTVEETEDDWTTRGWEPPPGTDRSPGGGT